MNSMFVVIFFLEISALALGLLTSFTDPEVDMNIVERIQHHGYPAEVHRITTEDDYVLALYRVPFGFDRTSDDPKNRSVVLLVPGMGGSPETYLLLRSRLSIPYYLADRGYDVWMLCVRGLKNVLGENHLKYDWDKDDEYWSFSMHEIGKYDLSAAIDHALKHTGQSKLSLIGHSAGGNEFYLLLSEKPSYNDKIKVMISWGSAPVLKRQDCPLIAFTMSVSKILRGLIERLHQAEMFPIINQLRPAIRLICDDLQFRPVCYHLLGVIASHRSTIFSMLSDDIPLFVSNLPRVAAKQLIHFMDNYSSGEFRQYDHGIENNLKLYGNRKPPAYNLSAATAPGVFFVTAGDSFIAVEDIYDSMKIIPNTIIVYDIAYKPFTHGDYIFSINATDYVYEPTYRILQDIDRGIIPPPLKVPAHY